jgi:hypothetical protein
MRIKITCSMNKINILYIRIIYTREHLYGLNSLTEEELVIHVLKRNKELLMCIRRAQIILNRFKQKIVMEYTNNLFQKLFPKSEITKVFNNYDNIDDTFKNTLTFKDLNISKEQIISIFMSEGILPKNFLSLQENPNQLPRLRNDKA